jgi:hypothetical protein
LGLVGFFYVLLVCFAFILRVWVILAVQSGLKRALRAVTTMVGITGHIKAKKVYIKKSLSL